MGAESTRWSPYEVIRLQRFLFEALRCLGSGVFASERAVFDFVLSRTLLWNKAAEHIPRELFTSARSKCYVFCSRRGTDRQDRRALNALVDGGLILRDGDLFAINLPAMLNIIVDYGDIRSAELKDLKELRNKALLLIEDAGFRGVPTQLPRGRHVRNINDLMDEVKGIERREARRKGARNEKRSEGHSLLRYMAERAAVHHEDVKISSRNTAKIRGRLTKIAQDVEAVAAAEHSGIGEYEEGSAIRNILDSIMKHWIYVCGGTVTDTFGNQVILPRHNVNVEQMLNLWDSVVNAALRAERLEEERRMFCAPYEEDDDEETGKPCGQGLKDDSPSPRVVPEWLVEAEKARKQAEAKKRREAEEAIEQEKLEKEYAKLDAITRKERAKYGDKPPTCWLDEIRREG